MCFPNKKVKSRLKVITPWLGINILPHNAKSFIIMKKTKS